MPYRILIIDDDTSLRRVLEYNLSEEGYDVIPAATGAEGLSLFDALQPDMVITDLKMPGISGFQVLAAVKKRSPHIPVMVITAFGAVDTAVEAMKLGAYDYITKPFNRDALRLTVRKALEMRGLAEENRRLKEELNDRAEFRNIIGISRGMERVFSVIRKVADTDATILITGESGTGKELVARAIHSLSSRRGNPFVAINCAAIPRDLLESELFGHVKGAFTGAIRDKTGKFQSAEGGTLFLDEVGELPVELQPKLLRALQQREVEPVGGTAPRKLDVRVVAATNSDLDEAIASGTLSGGPLLPAGRHSDPPPLFAGTAGGHPPSGQALFGQVWREYACCLYPGGHGCAAKAFVARQCSGTGERSGTPPYPAQR